MKTLHEQVRDYCDKKYPSRPSGKRTLNVLLSDDIYNFDQLMKKKISDLFKLPNCGRHVVGILCDIMHQNGFTFSEEVSIGKSKSMYVIVRTYAAGVFAGEWQGNGQLKNSRRLWRWHTANNGISLDEVATYGLNYEKSKICCNIEYRRVENVEEIIVCTSTAEFSIKNAPDYIAPSQ